jgi:hypothetical protein
MIRTMLFLAGQRARLFVSGNSTGANLRMAAGGSQPMKMLSKEIHLRRLSFYTAFLPLSYITGCRQSLFQLK